MTVDELIEALQFMRDRNPDCGGFDVVAYGPDGKPRLAPSGVSIAEPGERILAVGCDGFILKSDLA